MRRDSLRNSPSMIRPDICRDDTEMTEVPAVRDVRVISNIFHIILVSFSSSKYARRHEKLTQRVDGSLFRSETG